MNPDTLILTLFCIFFSSAISEDSDDSNDIKVLKPDNTYQENNEDQRNINDNYENDENRSGDANRKRELYTQSDDNGSGKYSSKNPYLNKPWDPFTINNEAFNKPAIKKESFLTLPTHIRPYKKRIQRVNRPEKSIKNKKPTVKLWPDENKKQKLNNFAPGIKVLMFAVAGPQLARQIKQQFKLLHEDPEAQRQVGVLIMIGKKTGTLDNDLVPKKRPLGTKWSL